MSRWLWIGPTLLLAIGCSSRTHITTHRDATIFDDSSNRALATGELWYEDSEPVWVSKTFRVEHPDCKTRWLTINRSDDVSVGRVFVGLFTLVPLLWSGDYEASYGVQMECSVAKASGGQQQQQQQQQTVIIGVPGVNVQGPGGGSVGAGCAKDTDCKGERVCTAGACVNPS